MDQINEKNMEKLKILKPSWKSSIVIHESIESGIHEPIGFFPVDSSRLPEATWWDLPAESPWVGLRYQSLHPIATWQWKSMGFFRMDI